MHCGAQDFHIKEDVNKDSTAPFGRYVDTVSTLRPDGCLSFVLIWIVIMVARLETNGYADAMYSSIVSPSSKVKGGHVRECQCEARAFRAKCMSHAAILMTLLCEWSPRHDDNLVFDPQGGCSCILHKARSRFHHVYPMLRGRTTRRSTARRTPRRHIAFVTSYACHRGCGSHPVRVGCCA